MARPVIICIDDQPEVLAAVTKDLAPFARKFEVVECDSAEEAWELLDAYDGDGVQIPLLVVDCVMPGQSGVTFLAQVEEDGRFARTRKILLTGQASHEDTIEAINQAHIDRYIGKPWQAEELRSTVSHLLTHWVFDSGDDHRDYGHLLDGQVVIERSRL